MSNNESTPGQVPESSPPTKPATSGTYDASSITALEGLEAVRKRPGMYIGNVNDGSGLHHMVFEVVDNGVDEALAGHADAVLVTIHDDGSVSVWDNGRGIPVGRHAKESEKQGRDISAAEVVMTVLHAGGKFGGEGYAVSGGLHGVGVSVVNALSKHVEVEVHREDHIWRQSYNRGAPEAPLAKGETTDKTGTTVTFWADDEIFETTRFDFEILSRRFQEMAFLNRGLALSLTDEREVKVITDEELAEAGEGEVVEARREVRYMYEGGIADFVTYLNSKKGPAHQHVIWFESEDTERGISAEVAMQWSNVYS